MSQAKPREFKFVDGRARKRRKRGTAQAPVPGLLTTSFASAPAISSFAATRCNVAKQRAHATEQQRHQHPNHPVHQTATVSTSVEGVQSTDPDVVIDPRLLVAQELNELISWTPEAEVNPFFDQEPYLAESLGFSDQPPVESVRTRQDPDCGSSHRPFQPLGQSNPNSKEPRGSNTINGGEESASRGDVSRCNGVPSTGYIPSPRDTNLIDSLTRLLGQYNKEFCVLPLTSDFEANPFRCNDKTSTSSQLLLHSILALSYRHVNRLTGSCATEAKEHKNEATKLLDSELQQSGTTVGLLDAMLILFTLDCATSAQGPWPTHLRRAYTIIDATAGGLASALHSPRARAQIEMLVWWDVTLALTSRRSYIMPENYVSQLFGEDDQDDDGSNDDDATTTTTKTFYNVSGCPAALFRRMVRLARYARERELAAVMTCVTFDDGPVLAVEREIGEWSAEKEGYGDACAAAALLARDGTTSRPRIADDDEEEEDRGDRHADGTTIAVDEEEGDGEEEEKANAQQDLHHCAEAWRYALLLYIERVFKSGDNRGGRIRGEKKRPVLALLARKTLDHVGSCRRSSMAQKQLLLPVFLAGCETKDAALRSLASEYCAWWAARTRYDMFATAGTLLEEVWAASGKSPTSWWGSVIDEKAGGRGVSCAADHQAFPARQYLFG